MKLDKYGDEVIEQKTELDKKAKGAFLVLSLLQFALITLNILVLVIDWFNFYICFVTAPMYIFLFIHFGNGYNANKETHILPPYLRIVKTLSPILYILTAIPAMFKLF